MQKLPLTIILLTFNEKNHLPKVFQNIVGWVEDVFIVDSLSTDRTVDIALEYGARVVQRPFTNFGDQWNWALENLPISTPWTLKLDPDERVSDELKEEIHRAINSDNPADGYSFTRRLWFMGKPLHVNQDVIRLWKTGRCSFSDVLVNEHPIIDGKVGKLNANLEHMDSPDLHHWMDKQNRYTTMLAIQRARGDALSAVPKFLGNSLERRMFFIQLFFKLPFRYQLQMLHELFVRGAWRDGRAGLNWARLRVESRRLRELKYKQICLTGRIPDLPVAESGHFDDRVLHSELQNRVMSGGINATVRG